MGPKGRLQNKSGAAGAVMEKVMMSETNVLHGIKVIETSGFYKTFIPPYLLSVKSIYRVFLIGIGVLNVGLGILGIFVPLMPSTVFFLIAAASFVKSSPQLYLALINHPTVGPHIYNYRTHRAMPRKAKKKAIAMLVVTLSISAFLVPKPLVWLILALVLVGVSAIILTTKTLEDIHAAQKPEPVDS